MVTQETSSVAEKAIAVGCARAIGTLTECLLFKGLGWVIGPVCLTPAIRLMSTVATGMQVEDWVLVPMLVTVIITGQQSNTTGSEKSPTIEGWIFSPVL